MENNPQRDCDTCYFRITKWIGRACAWCECGIIDLYRPRDYYKNRK